MTISIVQSKKITNALSGSFNSNTTAGNCVVVIVTDIASSGSPSVSGVTLGGSADNFTWAKSANNPTLPKGHCSIWFDYDCAGGQKAIVVSGTDLTVSTDTGILIYEVAGLLADVSVLDKTSSGSSDAGTNWSSGSTAATSQDSEIWFGAANPWAGNTLPGSPWTSQAFSSANIGGGYRITTASGAAAYSGTQDYAQRWAACIATFKGVLGPTSTGGLARRRFGFSADVLNAEPGPVSSTGHLSLPAYRFDGTSDTITSFPEYNLPAKVEILLGDTWTDISDYVYQRDNITITRGRPDEASTAGPGSCTITLDNRDGRFSPRNPMSPYYGLIGRNTQCRVIIGAIVAGMGNSYRFWGEISYWPPQWDPSLQDLYITVTVNGILRRLSQQREIGSPLRNYFVQLSGSSAPVAYWPMEDADQSSYFSSGLPGGVPMNWIGSPSPASDTSVPGSSALPTFASASARGVVTYAAQAAAGPGRTETVTDQYKTAGTYSWVCPSGVTSVEAWVQGPGAGGAAGMTFKRGLGGGAGGLAYKASVTVIPGHSYTVVVGARGVHGVYGVNSGAGGDGAGDSSFAGESDTLTGSPGSGGTRDDKGIGGGADGGDTNTAGGNGGGADDSLMHGTGGGAPGQSCPYNSKGAPRPGGGDGGNSYYPYNADNGNNGGGGGGGGCNHTNSSGPGGYGGDGYVKLRYERVIPGTGGAGFATESANVFRFILSIPDGGITDNTVVARLLTSGTIAQLDIIYHTGGNLTMTGFDGALAQKFTSGSKAFDADGTPLLVSAEMLVNGTGMDWVLSAIRPLSPAITSFTGNVASINIGDGINITFNPDSASDAFAAGHASLSYASGEIDTTTHGALEGYEGETAEERFARLCEQFGIPYQVMATSDNDSALMGAQTDQNFVNIIQECETADGGIIFEGTSFFGLGYITRPYLMNPGASATLDFSSHLTEFRPVADDQFTKNDITVGRVSGSSYRVYAVSGEMSVLDPPDGVGQYADSVSVNVLYDSQLPDIAGWKLYWGTAPEMRHPVASIDMSRNGMTSVAADIVSADIGMMYVVTNLPDFFTYKDEVKQVIFGMTEVINARIWTISWNAVPAEPYLAAIAGDEIYGRIDTDGSSLASDCSAGATLLGVTSDIGNALWTTDPGDTGFDINIGGEQITVTDVSGSSNPQTFNVIRAVNGVIKAHSAGDSVSLWTTPIVDY